MKALILAGGLGTRLRPVTYEIPKPLLPIQGKTLTEHVLDILKSCGVDEVYLSICYQADKVKKYFGDGKKFSLKINYLVENEPLGTGGWMHLIKKPEEDMIVLNGDNLFDLDMKAFLDFHKQNKAVVSIALTKVEDVQHYGIADLHTDKIIRFLEKPKPEEAPSNYANSGYYIFSPQAFDFIPEKKAFMLENDLFPLLAQKGLLFGFKSSAQWFDTGTFERWEQVIKYWRKK